MFRIVAFVILLLSGLIIFDLNVISRTDANIIRIIGALYMLIILLITTTNYNNIKIDKNTKYICLFYIGIFINISVMWTAFNVSTYHSFFVTLNFTGFIMYFYLNKFPLNPKTIEKAFIFFAFVVSIIMLVQQIYNTTPMFNQLEFHENFMEQRNTVRVRIPGMALVVIACFYKLENYLKYNKIIDLVSSIFFFIIISTQGFRAIIFVTLLCSLILYFKVTKKSIINPNTIRFAMLILVSFFALLQVPYLKSIVESLIEATIQTQELGREYIRFYTWDYYLVKIKSEIWMYLTGNGLYQSTSPIGLFAADLGIWGFYSLAGVLPALSLLIIWIRGIRSTLSSKHYLSVFFIYVILNAFLFNYEAFRPGIFNIYAIVLFLQTQKEVEYI